MKNLCVINLNDGGDLILEDSSKGMEVRWIKFFEDGLKNDEWEKVSVDDGLVMLDEYFSNYGERSEEDKIEWGRLKEKFKKYVESLEECELYVWGVEYDLSLMVIDGWEKVS